MNDAKKLPIYNFLVKMYARYGMFLLEIYIND